MQMSKGGY